MDYAIISLKGHQYLVKPGDELIVEKKKKKEGNEIEIS